MKIIWAPGAWKDYLEFKEAAPLLAVKIDELITDIQRSPFKGLGKPEPLRGDLAGLWSRRISKGHRLVYRIAGSRADQRLEIIQCRFHY